jgi:serine protease Do
MKKLISYVLVFVLGFAACAYVLYRVGALGSGGPESVLQAVGSKPNVPVAKLGENPIADAAALVGPAIVNIDMVGERRVTTPFGDLGDLFGGAPRQRVVGQGSGVLISEDGYILTNNHVVADAQDVQIRLADGRTFKARLVGRDRATDIAVVRISGKNLPSAKLGDSDAIRVGDWAIAVGNPFGLGNTVTVGVISATKRTDLPVAQGQVIKEAIQTDAAINRGNSGGALVNLRGEVIGINTAIFSPEPGQGNVGIGFAIPINSVRNDIKELIGKGKILRPYLGVALNDLDPEMAMWYKQRGLDREAAALVADVAGDSPAAQAGIQQYDVITDIDGKKIKGAKDVTEAVGAKKVGDVIRITVWREGQTRVIGAKLAEIPQTWSWRDTP